jgi:hypothetical protein
MDRMKRLDELLSMMTDGGLDDTARKELQEIIQESANAKEKYLSYCQMHAMLNEESGSFAANSILFSKEIERVKKPVIFWILSAVAMLCVLGLSTLIINNTKKGEGPHPYRGESIAKVSKAVGVEFAYGGKGNVQLKDGDSVDTGLYTLLKGVIEIKYPSGARVVFESPNTFEIMSSTVLGCNEGKLSVFVPKQARGFTVSGAGVSIVDLGTEFSVHVVKEEFLEAHVFKGSVEVNRHYENGDEKSRVMEGQAVRVLMSDAGPVLAGVDLKHDFFIRQMVEPDSDYSRLILEKEPVVYYPMEIPSDGKTLHDWSKFKNNGTSAGVKDFASLWTVGKIGASIQISGSNRKSYVYVDSYPQSTDGKLTGIGWVYAESRPSWATIMKNWGQDKTGQFHFGLETKGYLDIEMADKAGNKIHTTDPERFPIKQWVHVAFIKDGNRVKLFRNGQVVATNFVEGMLAPVPLKKMSIGTKLSDDELGPSVTPGHWDGRLDEISLFNKALSDEEIIELYEISK